MFNNPTAAVEAKDIATRPVAVLVSRPRLEAVKDYKIPFGDRAIEMDTLAWV